MARKLVVLSDGSWISPQFRSRNRRVPGNATLTYQCIAEATPEGDEQRLYLHDHEARPALHRRLMQRTFGLGMKAEIIHSYRFLCDNYRTDAGDEIYLLGAGLGAFNIRRLAHLIDKVGILPADRPDLHAKAYEYSQIPVEALQSPAAEALAAELPVNRVRIRFLGCWDTVGSYGLPLPGLHHISQSWMTFNDHRVNGNVDFACQALALDERRSRFKPGLWTGLQSPETRKVEQVWFAGSHENVVGGRRDSRLSDIALHWMIDRLRSEGLHIDMQKLEQLTSPDINGRIAMNRRKVAGIPIPFRKPFNRPFGQTGRLSDHSGMEPEKLHESVLIRRAVDRKYRPRQIATLPDSDLPVYCDFVADAHDKRRHPRITVDWPGFVIANGAKITVSLVDYSRYGAKIWLEERLPEGTSLVLQSSRAFSDGLKSQVVWAADHFHGIRFATPISREAMG
ncbi:DUF2235 domain-containing protein [Sneathiella sp.]|uniref:DUF2235 domain-containing protein n=1 Tax=Sneathiella sp. TaxID=1964365 RepID=UPI002FDF36D9